MFTFQTLRRAGRPSLVSALLVAALALFHTSGAAAFLLTTLPIMVQRQPQGF